MKSIVQDRYGADAENVLRLDEVEQGDESGVHHDQRLAVRRTRRSR